MKYMLLVYLDEQAMTEEERAHCYVESAQLAQDLSSKGHYLDASPLHPVATATSVRVRDGKRLVTDGPFAETREQLGGYYLIEAKDLDEAIGIAERIPPAGVGTIEIRPVMEISGLPMKNTGTLRVTTPTVREIVMTRVFDAPRSLVFDALTKPELVKRWLLGPPGWSMVVCEIDLKVGGAYRYVWRHTDGTEIGMGGVYREIAPPERSVHTESFDVPWYPGKALITTVLVEQGGRTTLTGTILYESREARDAVLKSPMEQGVAASYDRLAEVLASIA